MTKDKQLQFKVIERWIELFATNDELLSITKELHRLTGKWQELVPLSFDDVDEQLKGLKPSEVLQRIIVFSGYGDSIVIDKQGYITGLTLLSIADEIRSKSSTIAADIVGNLDKLELPSGLRSKLTEAHKVAEAYAEIFN